MNNLTVHKLISYFRSAVYLMAALICFIVVFSFSEGDPSEPVQSSADVRIMTYNIHHGEGLDGVVDLKRIADIINDINPHILLLQEVDVNLERSGFIDIPKKLSEMTGLEHFVFGKNLDLEDGAYGNATLLKFPVTHSKNYQFEKKGPEQRGVLVAKMKIDDRELLVMNTHFDHSEDDSERILYSKKVVEEILPEYDTDAVLFGGDFNDIPTSRMIHKLNEKFEDAWVISGQGEGFTIPANQPSKRIDYIMFMGSIQPDSIWIPDTEASDHLPVVTDFVWVDEN